MESINSFLASNKFPASLAVLAVSLLVLGSLWGQEKELMQKCEQRDSTVSCRLQIVGR
jgi:hypothetical protein